MSNVSGSGNQDSRPLDRGVITRSVLNSVMRGGKFNVCSVNIQSVSAGSKMDELRFILSGSKASLVVVSETWANSRVSDDFLAVDGYKFMRHDRIRRRGGGLVVYCSLGVVWALVEKSSADCATEYMAVELRFDGRKFLVFAVYNPPGTPGFVELLGSKMRCFQSCYDDVFVVGDLNLDFSVSSFLLGIFLTSMVLLIILMGQPIFRLCLPRRLIILRRVFLIDSWLLARLTARTSLGMI